MKTEADPGPEPGDEGTSDATSDACGCRCACRFPADMTDFTDPLAAAILPFAKLVQTSIDGIGDRIGGIGDRIDGLSERLDEGVPIRFSRKRGTGK